MRYPQCFNRLRLFFAISLLIGCAGCSTSMSMPLTVRKPELGELKFRHVTAHRTQAAILVTGYLQRPWSSRGILSGRIRLEALTANSETPVCAYASRSPFTRRGRRTARFSGKLPVEPNVTVIAIEVRFDTSGEDATCT